MPVSVDLLPLRLPSGQLAGVIDLLRDDAAREADERERDRFFTLSLDQLCVASLDSYFRRLNPAFERTLGFTLEDLRSRSFLEFIHPEDQAATLAELQRLSSGVPSISFENRYRCKDGTYKDLLWTSAPDPKAGLTYATARDITEQKQAARALRDSEAKARRSQAQLNEAQQTVHLGSCDWDISNDQLTWSDQMFRLYGIERADLETSHLGSLKWVVEEDRAPCRRHRPGVEANEAAVFVRVQGAPTLK